MAQSIPIVLNGDATEVAASSTLLDLLDLLERDPRAVAVEHNGEIVPRSTYGDLRLAAGDRLEVVQFVQGG